MLIREEKVPESAYKHYYSTQICNKYNIDLIAFRFSSTISVVLYRFIDLSILLISGTVDKVKILRRSWLLIMDQCKLHYLGVLFTEVVHYRFIDFIDFRYPR